MKGVRYCEYTVIYPVRGYRAADLTGLVRVLG